MSFSISSFLGCRHYALIIARFIFCNFFLPNFHKKTLKHKNINHSYFFVTCGWNLWKNSSFQRGRESAGLYQVETKPRLEKNKSVYFLLPSLTSAHRFTKNRARNTWKSWFRRWPQAAASLPLLSGWCPSALPAPALQPPPTQQPVFLCPTGPHCPEGFSHTTTCVLCPICSHCPEVFSQMFNLNVAAEATLIPGDHVDLSSLFGLSWTQSIHRLLLFLFNSHF